MNPVASATARAFIPDAILILGVMALLLAGLWHLADPDERPLLVEPNGAPVVAPERWWP